MSQVEGWFRANKLMLNILKKYRVLYFIDEHPLKY